MWQEHSGNQDGAAFLELTFQNNKLINKQEKSINNKVCKITSNSSKSDKDNKMNIVALESDVWGEAVNLQWVLM